MFASTSPEISRLTAERVVVDRDRRMMSLGLAISVALHVSVVVVGLLIANLFRFEFEGTARDLEVNISIIPLSALNTNLPAGAERPFPLASPPLANKESSPPSQTAPEKEAPTLSLSKSSPQESRSDRAMPKDSDKIMRESSHQNSSSTLGVSNGDGDPSLPARVSYQDMVATLIAKSKRYPERALRRHTTGSGTVRLTIIPTGDVEEIEIVQSTSSPILDQELKEMVERASPFPPFPKDLTRDSLVVVLPVAFQLRQ